MPMSHERKFKKREFRRIMEIAMQTAADRSPHADGYSIEVMKSTAVDMGIAPENVERAAKIFESEQATRRRRINIAVTTMVLFFAVAGFIVWLSMPQPFTGSVVLTLTTGVSDDFLPYDNLKTFNPFFQKKVFCYTTFYGLEYLHDIDWEFYNPENQLQNRVSLTLESTKDAYNAYGTCMIGINSPPGTWRVIVLADKQKIAEQTFLIEFSGLSVTLTPSIDANDKPTEVRTSFSLQEDAKVYCYLNWDKVEGNHNVEWKFKGPDGVYEETKAMEINATGTGWWVYNSMELTGKKPGEWQVDIFMNTIPITRRTFTLTE